MSRCALILSVLALIPATSLAGAVEASLFFDFGETVQPTPNYNNIDQLQNPIFNAIDSNGVGTGITVMISDLFWPGSNQQGTLTPSGAAAQFDPQATRDNLFGNTVLFGGFTEPTAQVKIGNLSAGKRYNFTFFGSRMGVTDNRETEYVVAGLNSDVTYLNASNNVSQVAMVGNIAPNASGEIFVSLAPGPNNNNASKFYYLGAMRIDVIPEPATALLALLGIAALRGRR